MSNPEIICIGLVVMDIIASPISKAVLEVDSSKLTTLDYQPGGDALNTAINMASLGASVALFGRCGADPAGREIKRIASQCGVNTDGLVLNESCATSTSIVMIDGQGDRHFAYFGENNDALSVKDINQELFRHGVHVHLGSAMALASLDGPGIARLFRKAKKRGCTTSMDVTWDVDGIWLDKIDEALRYTDFFLPSHYEARFITKKETPEEMAAFFAAYGIKRLVIKMGAQGCFCTDFNKAWMEPAADVETEKVVDTTGAGDCFVAGFLLGTLRGLDFQSCTKLGSLLAGECIQSFGATAGIRERFKDNPAELRRLLKFAVEG
jgi:sugar/nucleoside kinase (ribokinase family)